MHAFSSDHHRASVVVTVLACCSILGCGETPTTVDVQHANDEAGDQVEDIQFLARTYYQRGTEVLWRADFSKFAEATLPPNLLVENGEIEVREINGRNFLSTVNGAEIVLVLENVLPKKFSLEIEYRSRDAKAPFIFDCANRGFGQGSTLIGSLGHQSFVQQEGVRSDAKADLPDGGLIHPRFTFDGNQLTAYINEQLLPALPDVKLDRGNRIRMLIPAGSDENPTVISVINIADGGQAYRIADEF